VDIAAFFGQERNPSLTDVVRFAAAGLTPSLVLTLADTFGLLAQRLEVIHDNQWPEPTTPGDWLAIFENECHDYVDDVLSTLDDDEFLQSSTESATTEIVLNGLSAGEYHTFAWLLRVSGVIPSDYWERVDAQES
jgi:hypothetical protein